MAALPYTERTFRRQELYVFRIVGRKLLWAYALLLLLAAVGYARYDSYIMDGDGTAFLDVAEALNTHHAGLAVNGYWNPGYPAVLAVAERVLHPSLWNELADVRYANVAIFALAMLACVFFTTGLTLARERWGTGGSAAVPAGAVHLLGLALLTMSLGRELPVAAPRSDTLLFTLLLFAGGLLVRVLGEPQRLGLYGALGVTLGCAYLTKSFAFLPSLALILGLLVAGGLRSGPARRYALAGTAVFAVLFAAVAGPYIVAISRQLGHFTTGESARLNYAFFIDMTGRWHEWYHHDLGHAGGVFLHPEAVLGTAPPTYSYAAHPRGTFPLWFDPAWWTLGLKPHVWLPGHLSRLARNVVVFFRYLLGRPEIFVLLAVLLAFGGGWPRPVIRDRATASGEARWADLSACVWFLAPIAWGVLMFAIYLPVDLQDRYLTAPLLLVVLPLFACLPCRAVPGAATNAGYVPVVATALVLLFAGTALSQAAMYLADRRRHTPLPEQQHPGFDPQIFTAAAALDKLGLQPGDKVACMGDLACYTDFYWARLAGTQILGEVETPGEANPINVWNGIADKRTVTAPLAGMGLLFIVSLFPNSAAKPQGWVQLGGSNFFAYPLRGTVSASEAAEVAAYRPTP